HTRNGLLQERAVAAGAGLVQLLEDLSEDMAPGRYPGGDLIALDRGADECLARAARHLRYTDIAVQEHGCSFRRGSSVLSRVDTPRLGAGSPDWGRAVHCGRPKTAV